MASNIETNATTNQETVTEQVNRVLDVGQILLSALTPDELDQLKLILASHLTCSMVLSLFSFQPNPKLGNTSVT